MRNFINAVIQEILKFLPREVTIINGRPHHSRSKGLVEKGNHLVEMQVQAMKCEHKDTGSVPWTDWLPQFNASSLLKLLMACAYDLLFL